jgi:hypothetical protein
VAPIQEDIGVDEPEQVLNTYGAIPDASRHEEIGQLDEYS